MIETTSSHAAASELAAAPTPVITVVLATPLAPVSSPALVHDVDICAKCGRKQQHSTMCAALPCSSRHAVVMEVSVTRTCGCCISTLASPERLAACWAWNNSDGKYTLSPAAQRSHLQLSYKQPSGQRCSDVQCSPSVSPTRRRAWQPASAAPGPLWSATV